MRQAIELYRGPKYVYYYDHRNKQSFDKVYGNPPEDTGLNFLSEKGVLG